MMRHQRNSLIAAALLSIGALTACVTITPACRHTVLSQLDAARDAGYEARIVTFKNTPEVRNKTGYRYHQAVEIKVGKEWGYWLPQPKTSWTATRKQPSGIILKTSK